MDLERLQARACAGDRDAQAELVRRYYPQVARMVHRELDRDYRQRHRWILPLFSTGDIVQEVFRGALTGLDGFVAEDEGAFIRYLATLVKHRLVDALRHHESARRDARRDVRSPTVVQRDGGGAADDPTPSIAASIAEQLEVFREVLESFPERERLLLELRLVEEEQYAEIAQKLGFPTGDAVRKAFNQVQARLLVRLRARGIQPPTME